MLSKSPNLTKSMSTLFFLKKRGALVFHVLGNLTVFEKINNFFVKSLNSFPYKENKIGVNDYMKLYFFRITSTIT